VLDNYGRVIIVGANELHLKKLEKNKKKLFNTNYFSKLSACPEVIGQICSLFYLHVELLLAKTDPSIVTVLGRCHFLCP
jgi:hypothetical protein